jgi:hypothetical protein
VISNPVKNRVISARAVVDVNQFLERQRTAAFVSQLPPIPNARNQQSSNVGTYSNRNSRRIPVTDISSPPSPNNQPLPAAPQNRPNRIPVFSPPVVGDNSYSIDSSNITRIEEPVTAAVRAVPHHHDRPVSIALSDIVRADLLTSIVSAVGDEPVEAEAFLADDLVFTVSR